MSNSKYIDDICNANPLLTVTQERVLIAKVRAGDLAAREKFILSNVACAIKAVSRTIRRFPHMEDDIRSEAIATLAHCVDTWKVEDAIKRNLRFSTWAFAVIQRKVYKSTWRDVAAVKITDHGLTGTFKNNSSDTLVAAPIDAPTDGEEGSKSLADILPDDSGATELQVAGYLVEVREAWARIASPRQREVIALRYGLTGKRPRSSKEIAKEMGVTDAVVSLWLIAGIKSLKSKFALYSSQVKKEKQEGNGDFFSYHEKKY